MSDTTSIFNPRTLIERYDTHLRNPWVAENPFIALQPPKTDLPAFPAARTCLPDPFWEGHSATVDCYWRAWELAFSNLKQPTPENGFAANYCDTAFNGNLFMWDSCFVTAFGLYGRRAFDFQITLDTFYRKQHPDGFICRELSETDGTDSFHRFDPSSTGPNVLGWAEWNHYLKTGNHQRLANVFPALVAYHQWMREYRTWPDGSYWTTGWGCGMDNMPRCTPGLTQILGQEEAYRPFGHGHLAWVDATFQALLSANLLLKMAELLGEEKRLAGLGDEVERLVNYANHSLWDEKTAFYYDRLPGGSLTNLKQIGSYWALLAGSVPPDRMASFLSHLENPAEFNRTHRIPSLSADDPHYSSSGGYWCGGVWAPTNYMVLKGLDQTGNEELAHQIASNHLANVVAVYAMENTPWTGAEQFRQFFHLAEMKFDDHHTLWENYAPDATAPGGHSKPGYVGWTGLPPIAVLFEDVFGLDPDVPANKLTWTIRQLEEHGVNRYPFGSTGSLDLKCHRRQSLFDRPLIEIHSDVPLTIEIVWKGGKETLKVESQP
jgi:hypothetical protein